MWHDKKKAGGKKKVTKAEKREAALLEHYRFNYRQHMERAGRFGMVPAEFNANVRKNFKGCFHPPTPQQWASAAFMLVTKIAGNRCCPNAVSRPCACLESWSCEEHGFKCVGSHD